MQTLLEMDVDGSFEIELNGKQVACRVVMKTVYDDCYSADSEDFENEMQKARHIQKLESGDLVPVGVIVTALALGCEGSDSLWAVVTSGEYTAQNAMEDHGMTENALDDLKKNIQAQIDALKPYMAA
jgi:hypothetical protein